MTNNNQYKIFTIWSALSLISSVTYMIVSAIIWYQYGFFTAFVIGIAAAAGGLLFWLHLFSIQQMTATNFGFVAIGTTIYKVEAMMVSTDSSTVET